MGEEKRKEELKKQEELAEKNAKEFKALLPKVKKDVKSAEDEVAKISRRLTELIIEPPEEEDALNEQLDDCLAEAEESNKKVGEVRQDIVTKQNDARKYVGQAKLDALKELGELQLKVNEEMKT